MVGHQRPTRRGHEGEVPVFDLDAVAPGQRLEGPAVVEAATTTVLLRAGEPAVVTPLGWLDITVA